MKLFHKIFFCFVLLFGIAFQAAGCLLIDHAYGNAAEQEKKYAFQEFQQNKYLLQSILYLEPDLFAGGGEELHDLAGSFTVPAALYHADGTRIFSNMDREPELPGSDGEDDGGAYFKISQKNETCGIFVYGRVRQGDTDVWLATETILADTRAEKLSGFGGIRLLPLPQAALRACPSSRGSCMRL